MFQTQELNVSRARPSATFDGNTEVSMATLIYVTWGTDPELLLSTGRHIRAINRFLSSQKRKCSTETDLKPEAVPENNALPFCKYTNLYQTLPVEKRLSGHLMSPVSQWQLKKILSIRRSGLSLKIVLFSLLQVMCKIAVARRISIFLTTALLWVAEEQFLCVALQLPHLGLNTLFNYFQFFSVAFLCHGQPT